MSQCDIGPETVEMLNPFGDLLRQQQADQHQATTYQVKNMSLFK
jgi:hypothetical protein